MQIRYANYCILLMKKSIIPVLSACMLLMTACTINVGGGSGYSASKIAMVTAFSFSEVDSLPGLGEAFFIVEELSDTGRIRMRENDSIRYGTPLNKVVPKLTYYTTPAGTIFYSADTSLVLTGNDTLDFTKLPISICVYAQDRSTTKWYTIEPRVHQTDPDAYSWEEVNAAVSTVVPSEQKAIMGATGGLYYYMNTGFATQLYTSWDEGRTWQQQSVNGLPSQCRVRQIERDGTVDGNMFVYAEGEKLYTSSDGADWTATAAAQEGYSFVTILPEFNGTMWAILEDSVGKYYLALRDTGVYAPLRDVFDGDTLPADFPVSHYTSVCFFNTGLHEHALLAGGYNRYGRMVNARWTFEYNAVYQRYAIANMADAKKSLEPFAGASMVAYNDKLWLYGGMWQGDEMNDSVYYSNDEGVNWSVYRDTLHFPIPEVCKGRQKQSVWADEDGNLYMIGGETLTDIYSDVFRGRLTSIDWPEIGN